MTQRTIPAGTAPTVIIKVGASVKILGRDGDTITAEENNHWGLQVEHKKQEFVVKMGGSGQVWVPFASKVMVYAGKNIEIQDIQGEVTAVAGSNISLRKVACLACAKAGGAMDIECNTLLGNSMKLEAGRDLRCYIREMKNARIKINDMGGYWEARIGDESFVLTLHAGGDATLVTDQTVEALPPDYILGQIIRPDPPEVAAAGQ